MSGTKMELRRYGGGEFFYWYEQEIIIDQNYLSQGNGLFVTLDYEYQPNTGQLDVYFNGQYLRPGGGYEEVDSRTIRLDLGTYPPEHPLAGQSVPLVEGDEIFIRIWKTEYRQGNGVIDEQRFRRLEDEVVKARRYKTTDAPYPDLDTRLDSIERRAEIKTMVFNLTRVINGPAPFEIRFRHDGEVVDVYASCSQTGTTRTVFQIEKCSQDSFDSGNPVWENILLDGLVIDAGEKSSRTSITPYTLQDTTVREGDHFRVNVVEKGDGIGGVSVEVSVRLK
jgi:hypothetical protein